MADPTNTGDALTMLKCPFCGKEATLNKRLSLFGPDGIRVDWSIECEHCHKSDGGKTYSTWYKVTDDELLEKVNPNNDDETPDGRARVIKAWNKRATAEPTTPSTGDDTGKTGEDTGGTTTEGGNTGSDAGGSTGEQGKDAGSDSGSTGVDTGGTVPSTGAMTG